VRLSKDVPLGVRGQQQNAFSAPLVQNGARMENIKGYSRLQTGLSITIAVLALVMVLYHLIGVLFSPLEPVLHANTHLTFVLLLVFLPALKNAVQKGQAVDSLVASILLLLGLIGVSYIYIYNDELQMRAGAPSSSDVVIGVFLIIVVIDACRRAQGIALPIFALIFIAYALFCQYLPSPFYQPPTSFPRLISWFAISLTQGIYGQLIYISANIIFMFVLFGTVLEITKARDFFSMVGILVARKLKGGSAQSSVISSALVGSITGSPAANIVITGAVTIPLMKRTGFRPTFAAAVEAAASSGGMFLPPVMGVAAFMMMSLTGLSYFSICMAAIIPALLYYLGLGWSVHLYASKEKIPASEEEIDLKLLLRRAPLFIVPFGLIVTLLALQYPPMYAAGWALLVGIFLGFISKETRPSLGVFIDSLTRGARTASSIATMLIMANMAFVSVMSLTALGPKVAGMIHIWGGESLIIVLVLTMIVSLLLGCITPISGAYLIVALVVTPLLLKMGISVSQAHFFALYYSVIGFLTPPTAPAVMVASGVAKAPFLRSTGQGLRLVASAYLLPFMFVYDPALLGQFTSGIFLGILSIVAAILTIISTLILFHNYFFTKLGWQEAGLALLSSVGFLAYFFTRGNIFTVVGGAACFASLTLLQLMRKKSKGV
jgi:TRAP transporter 4TM/12TM fusion protein